jgi:tRNA threonylcarbamoyladenosine biosynthesis protein TsaE
VIYARTSSAADTQALAAALAELARPGDLFLLAGDLGAGKTAFTQGFGSALGVEDRITSPTFTLANTYTGRLELNHLDVYRLEALAEVLDLGVSEMLDDGGVAVIEWGDTVAPALPADYLEIRFSFTEGGDEERILDLVPVGGRWQARTRALAAALAPWIHEADVPPSPAAWLEPDEGGGAPEPEGPGAASDDGSESEGPAQ